MDTAPLTSIPLTIFLVGATGDLAKKKLWKAFYHLYLQQLLPEKWQVIGIARSTYTLDEFRDFVEHIIKPTSQSRWTQFVQHIEYHSGDISERSSFESLADLPNLFPSANRLWFLATLPSLYLPVIKHLRSCRLTHQEHGWSKLLLEKPFGTDLKTASALNNEILQTFSEEQIYRIDHFLAKETVQNILVFRFANGIFEELWSAEHVDHIEIVATEQIGIGGRADFYDATGTLRDVVQNHVLQMLATTLMEEPASLHSETVRQKRYELLEKLSIATPEKPANSVVLGQYTAGVVAGEPVVGYLQESGVPPSSQTETAVALKLQVHNKRWSGVPIYIFAGKRLHSAVTEISIHFKERSNRMFAKHQLNQVPTVLTFRIQPNESVSLRLSVKQPGIELAMQEVPLQFSYRNEFQVELIEAYVKLLHDAIQSDSTLFAHAKDIEETWRVIDPLLKVKSKLKVFPYPAGTGGPAEFGLLGSKKP